MARVNVYLPDELAAEARAAGLNVSNVTQEALRDRLAGRRTTAWLATVRNLPPTGISHNEVIAALDEVRAEAGDEWPTGRPVGRSR
jgi:post-segregation antitoxin (ccd killing protein)